MSQNGKGDKPRISNYKKYQDNYLEIDWSDKKELEKPFYPCYICGSEENKPTDFKHFCSRCGNKP
jgi:hypothetical protein